MKTKLEELAAKWREDSADRSGFPITEADYADQFTKQECADELEAALEHPENDAHSLAIALRLAQAQNMDLRKRLSELEAALVNQDLAPDTVDEAKQALAKINENQKGQRPDEM